MKLTDDIISGKYVSRYGLSQVSSEADLLKVRSVYDDIILPSLRLWEFFVVDVSYSVRRFKELMELKLSDSSAFCAKYPNLAEAAAKYLGMKDTAKIQEIMNEACIKILPEGGRWSVVVDMSVALALFGTMVSHQYVTSRLI